MKREMYLKPEIEIQEVSLEPFMIISGNGTDIPFGAPMHPEEEDFIDKRINTVEDKSLWEVEDIKSNEEVW